MKFKIDENLPIELAELLRAEGYDALTVDDQKMRGNQDSNLAKACKIEDRILVTLDTDFADIRLYPPEQHPGLLVLRLSKQDKAHVLSVFRRTFKVLAEEPIVGHLWVIEETRIRVR